MGKSVYDIAAMLDIMLPKRSSFSRCTSDRVNLRLGVGKNLGVTDSHWLAFSEEDNRLFDKVINLLGDQVIEKDVKIEGHLELAQAEYHGGEFRSFWCCQFVVPADHQHLSGIFVMRISDQTLTSISRVLKDRSVRSRTLSIGKKLTL